MIVGGDCEKVLSELVFTPEATCEVLSDRDSAESISQIANNRFLNAPKIHLLRNLPRDLIDLGEERDAPLLLVDGATFTSHLRLGVEKAARTLDMISGYATPRHVVLAGLAEEIAHGLSSCAASARRPVAVHDELDVLPPDRNDITRLAFGEPDSETRQKLRGYAARPPEAGVKKHAQFLVRTQFDELTPLHRGLSPFVAYAAFSYWRNAFVNISGDDESRDAVRRALEILNQLESEIAQDRP